MLPNILKLKKFGSIVQNDELHKLVNIFLGNNSLQLKVVFTKESGDGENDDVGASVLVLTAVRVEVDVAKRLLSADASKKKGSSVAVDHVNKISVVGVEVDIITVAWVVSEKG